LVEEEEEKLANRVVFTSAKVVVGVAPRI